MPGDRGRRTPADPGRRDGQRRLAREIVALVHGSTVVDPIEAASALLFGRPSMRSSRDRSTMAPSTSSRTRSRPPRPTEATWSVATPSTLVVECGLAKSKGEVRRNATGHYVNQVVAGRPGRPGARRVRPRSTAAASCCGGARARTCHVTCVGGRGSEPVRVDYTSAGGLTRTGLSEVTSVARGLTLRNPA